MKKLVVLGAGESGVGTALLGIKEGFEVFVSDFGKIKEKYKQVLLHHEINWEDEGHSEEKIIKASLVMKSPGIPDTAPLVVKLKKLGIPVIDIIDFKFGPGNSFWHSSEDKLENISAKSLNIIGLTSLNLLFLGKF